MLAGRENLKSEVVQQTGELLHSGTGCKAGLIRATHVKVAITSAQAGVAAETVLIGSTTGLGCTREAASSSGAKFEKLN